MSMTLAEAIKHAEEEAGRTMGLCSMEHKQLAEWLKELANLRAMVAGQTAFHSDEAVNAELARLRDLARDTELFLSELPKDLGRGSLNGMKVQLQHKLAALTGRER
jgi:hypothetical protein